MQMRQSKGDTLQREGVKREKRNVVQSRLAMADPRPSADDGTNYGRPC